MSNMRMREDVIIFPSYVDSKPVCVLSTGISYCDKTYKIQRKNSDCYSVELVLSGKGYIKTNKTYAVEKDDVFIAHAHTNHCYYADKHQPFTKIWFLVMGELADLLFKSYQIDKPVYKSASCSDIFFELFNLAKTGISYEKICHETAMTLHKLLGILSLSKNKESTWVESLKEQLDNSFKKKVKLDELVSQIGISKSQLIRGFKASYGVTPYKYLLKLKLEASLTMLKYTEIPIRQIAFDLNFADEFYFSNAFKKHFGLSPQKFRRSGTLKN